MYIMAVVVCLFQDMAGKIAMISGAASLTLDDVREENKRLRMEIAQVFCILTDNCLTERSHLT